MKRQKLTILMYVALCTGAITCAYAAKNGNGNGGEENGSHSSHGFACKEINRTSDFPKVGKKPVVSIFFTKTCSACADIKGSFNNFVEKYESYIDFVAVDADGAQELSKLFNIDHVPAFVVINKKVGGMPENIMEQYFLDVTGLKNNPLVSKKSPAQAPEQDLMDTEITATGPEMFEEEFEEVAAIPGGALAVGTEEIAEEPATKPQYSRKYSRSSSSKRSQKYTTRSAKNK